MHRMGYQALLFCPEEKTARVVTQVLNELEFSVEPCSEPFAAVKKLMAQHFDALVVDCDNEQNATLLFKGRAILDRTRILCWWRLSKARPELRKHSVSAPTWSLPNLLMLSSRRAHFAWREVSSAREKQRNLQHKHQRHLRSTRLWPLHRFRAEFPPPVASTSAFELDVEPAPQPDASEAALLEYMPDSVPTGSAPANSGRRLATGRYLGDDQAVSLATGLEASGRAHGIGLASRGRSRRAIGSDFCARRRSTKPRSPAVELRPRRLQPSKRPALWAHRSPRRWLRRRPG